jgi:hypothetical protein
MGWYTAKMRSPVVLLACLFARAAAAAQHPPSAKTQAEARAVVDKWLAAQNQGDFAAYQSLYAQRFGGIRRSGPRTVRMNRERWMSDRARMFKKKMVVSIDKLAMRVSRARARIDFQQTWASGSYKDAGPKRLELTRERGAFKIAREEMLRSQLMGPPPPAATALHEDELLLGYGHGLAIEFGRGECEGDVDTKSENGALSFSCKADESKLVDDVKEMKGKTVVMYDGDGTACEGTIGGFHLEGEGVFDHIPKDEDDEDEDMSSQADMILIADVEGGCSGWYGHLKGATKPRALAVGKPSGAEEQSAREALERSALWKRLQSQASDSEDAPAWDTRARSRDVASIAWGGGTWVTLSAIEPGGCGDEFSGAIWALVQLDKKGRNPRLVSEEAGYNELGAAFELGGRLYLIEVSSDASSVDRSLIRIEPDGKQTQIRHLVERSFHGCPC